MLIPSERPPHLAEADGDLTKTLQSLLDASASPLALLDERGSIIAVNAAWRSLMRQSGYNDTHNDVGTNYLEACERDFPASDPNLASGIRSVMLGQLSEFQMEYTLHSPIQRRWYNVCVSPLQWFNRPCIMVTHTNITDYKLIQHDLLNSKRSTEDLLEQAQAEIARLTQMIEQEREIRATKNHYLSMMSHELRTPITSIGLSYDMLKKYAAVSTPEERAQALENIRSQVAFLSEMVSDVMTLSRFEGDGYQIHTEDSDLITYCRDVVEEFQFNYAATHQVEFECEESTLRAPIDRKLLRGALTNLLSNAIKYSPRGGLVLFRLSVSEEWALIHISDSGIGIPVHDQDYLFEPFHRAANVDDLPGTGLGLPVTKQMIELHKGSITFESQQGIGTTFEVRLPL